MCVDAQTISLKYLGVPYAHGGRSMAGFDCYGLVISVYKDFGVDLFDIQEGYSESWEREGKDYLVKNYWRQWERVTSPRFADIALFKTKTRCVDGVFRDVPSHLGIMLDPWSFIHAHKPHRQVVVGRLSSFHWRDRVEGFYRFKKEGSL
jgi:cell wall-associated NlpC family hydrolase